MSKYMSVANAKAPSVTEMNICRMTRDKIEETTGLMSFHKLSPSLYFHPRRVEVTMQSISATS